jgi:hypothetical protein
METLLRCRSITEAEAYWKSREMTRTGGWNTAISEPLKVDPDGVPAVTFESDSYGMAVRMPGDIPPTGIPAILTTNNFYIYNPRTGTEGDPAPILPTHYRYIAMNDTLNRFISEGRNIGTAEMIEILQSASNSTSLSRDNRVQLHRISRHTVLCRLARGSGEKDTGCIVCELHEILL